MKTFHYHLWQWKIAVEITMMIFRYLLTKIVTMNFTKSFQLLRERPLLTKMKIWIKRPKKRKIYKNKKNFFFFFFCETDVSNFSRHLFRNHNFEKEVQEIINLPKKDPRRVTQIQNLRKLRNFTIYRPVRNTHVFRYRTLITLRVLQRLLSKEDSAAPCKRV